MITPEEAATIREVLEAAYEKAVARGQTGRIEALRPGLKHEEKITDAAMDARLTALALDNHPLTLKLLRFELTRAQELRRATGGKRTSERERKLVKEINRRKAWPKR